MSLAESLTNVAVGFGLAWACNALMLPAFDLHPKRAALLAMTSIMTGVSVARSFTLRRLFETFRIRRVSSANTRPGASP
jgi:hypothetical protein